MIWDGSLDPCGYGHPQRMPDGTSTRPHRAMWIAIHGDPPEGMVIDHLCGNPACIAPAHLEAVTRSVNARRAASFARKKVDLEEATALREAGASYQSIANVYGVHLNTVRRVLVPPPKPKLTPLSAMSCEERRAALERIMGNARRADPSDPDSCLLWTKYVSPNGYGRTGVKGHSFLAHRAVYYLSTGSEIPKGMHIGHTCANRRCIEPSHLELMSPGRNCEERAVRYNPHLNDSVVEKVRQSYALNPDQSFNELARSFSVDNGWVAKVVQGRTRLASPGPVLGRDYEVIAKTA